MEKNMAFLEHYSKTSGNGKQWLISFIALSNDKQLFGSCYILIMSLANKQSPFFCEVGSLNEVVTHYFCTWFLDTMTTGTLESQKVEADMNGSTDLGS